MGRLSSKPGRIEMRHPDEIFFLARSATPLNGVVSITQGYHPVPLAIPKGWNHFSISPLDSTPSGLLNFTTFTRGRPSLNRANPGLNDTILSGLEGRTAK